jgi:hypothetical protein
VFALSDYLKSRFFKRTHGIKVIYPRDFRHDYTMTSI